MATFFHLYTQQEGPQTREAERTWFSPTSRREHCCIKIYTDKPRKCSQSCPSKYPSLKKFPRRPHTTSDCPEGSVLALQCTNHYPASWAPANPKRCASPNRAAPCNCLAYLPSLSWATTVPKSLKIKDRYACRLKPVYLCSAMCITCSHSTTSHSPRLWFLCASYKQLKCCWISKHWEETSEQFVWPQFQNFWQAVVTYQEKSNKTQSYKLKHWISAHLTRKPSR